ncbi:hypothetical protein BJ742DRAFT_345740 [Cladochytrium replicatum]|nr:hypothetical protein BJ742DRAFT_345740 [Cladochytrium replicatum]
MGNLASKRREVHAPAPVQPNSESGSIRTSTSQSTLNSHMKHQSSSSRVPEQMQRFFSPATSSDVSNGSRQALQQYYLIKTKFPTNFMGVSRNLLSTGINVLDAGVLTGTWLAEMEQEFPASKFYGLDLSFSIWTDMQLMHKRKRMYECNSLTSIPFTDNTFDYVHEQTNLFVTPETDWPQAISELTRVLKPGGYIDIVEVDPVPLFAPTASEASEFLRHSFAHIAASGVNLVIANKLGDYVEATGSFTDIELIRRTIPIGWDGEIGRLCRIHMLQSYMSLMPLLGPSVKTASGAPPTVAEYQKFCEEFFNACAAAESYCQIYRITARKKNT